MLGCRPVKLEDRRDQSTKKASRAIAALIGPEAQKARYRERKYKLNLLRLAARATSTGIAILKKRGIHRDGTSPQQCSNAHVTKDDLN